MYIPFLRYMGEKKREIKNIDIMNDLIKIKEKQKNKIKRE